MAPVKRFRSKHKTFIAPTNAARSFPLPASDDPEDHDDSDGQNHRNPPSPPPTRGMMTLTQTTLMARTPLRTDGAYHDPDKDDKKDLSDVKCCQPPLRPPLSPSRPSPASPSLPMPGPHRQS